MKAFFVWLLLFLPCALFSESGERFDFFCLDGQHVRNAEIDHETEDGYYVRLPYLNDLIFVDRNNLREPPVLKKKPGEKKPETSPLPGKVKPQGRWKFGLVGSYAYTSLALSPLGEIFAPSAALSAGGLVFLPRPLFRFIDGFHVFASRYEYSNDPRFIRILTGYAGVRLSWLRYDKFTLKLITEISGGVARVDMRGFTFARENISFMTSGMIGFSVNPGPFYFSAGAGIDYFQDSDVVFSPISVILRVGFTL